MKRGFFTGALWGAAVVLGFNASAADDLFTGAVVARGKGVEVRRSQLDDAFVAYRVNLAARNQNVPEERRQAAEAMLLDRIIITQLLTNRASEADRTKARESANKFLENTRKTVENDEAFLRQLRTMGMTPSQFTNRVFEQAIAEEVISRDVKNKIDITDAQMRAFYSTNEALFRTPEQARTCHILIATRDLRSRAELSADEQKLKREKAMKILARAKAGEDFAQLVQEASEEPGVKENKGIYLFARAKDDPRRPMMPEFEAAAFSMKTNQVSDLVTTEYGYHIIKLLELMPARRMPLTEAKPRIMDYLTQTESEKEMPAFFKRLKDEAKVEVLDAKLAAELAAKPAEGALK